LGKLLFVIAFKMEKLFPTGSFTLAAIQPPYNEFCPRSEKR
jgi:hypothetical protein